MLRNFIVCFLLVLSTGPAAATDAGKYIVSGSFRLERSVPYKRGIESATWTGRVLITGKLYLDIDRTPDMPDATGNAESFLSFVPDKASLGVLPKVSGNVYPARPTLLNLRNASLATLGLESILSAIEIEKIHLESFGHYEWPASLLMTGLKTDIGCDSRYFYSGDYQITIRLASGKRLDRPKHLGC
jgi:hypothetical protein